MPTVPKKFIGPAVFLLWVSLAAYAGYSLKPAAKEAPARTFEIRSGEGFRSIVRRLGDDGFVRSPAAFSLFSLLSGSASRLQPGIYRISPQLSGPALLDVLVKGLDREVEVVIPEGSSLYQVESILSERGVIAPGTLVRASSSGALEGTLFPDTYRFFLDSDAETVIRKFKENFFAKAAPLLGDDAAAARATLILASLLEKEVPEAIDRQIVAGILEKRLAAGVALQVDASICYAKQLKKQSYEPCRLAAPVDFAISSPYNTYLHRGLPPGPIGSPGRAAIEAALHPKTSPYWFYLSDPATQKTVFAKTLDEHNQNRVKYLVR